MQTSSYLRGIGILLLSFGALLGFTAIFSSFEEPLYFRAAEAGLGSTVSGSIALLLSFYVQEDESAFWSIRSNISKRLRRGLGVSLLLFAFVFFAPIIHTTWPCNGYSLCLSNPNGLESIGYFLTGWGTVYFFELGFPFVFVLATIPIIVTSLVVMSPDLVLWKGLLGKIVKFA